MNEKNTTLSNGNLSGVYEQRTDEYATPKEIILPLSRSIDRFDLDPCAGAEEIPHAAHTYQKEDDGLSQDWFGKVWVNPPYSELDSWIDKIISEQSNTECIIALVPDRINADWFQKGVNHANIVCFHDGCISFGNSSDTAPFGSIYLVYGNPPQETIQQLNNLGETINCNSIQKQTTL